MGIKINWEKLGPQSEGWNYRHVLYAYLDSRDNEIVYIGLAWHRTVHQRLKDTDKHDLFEFFRDELGIRSVTILVGDVEMDGRLTRQLLSDVESLLIKRIKPAGNIMCRRSRITRPGMRLQCEKHWPHKRLRFIDR